MKTRDFRMPADSEQKERSREQDEHMETKLDEALKETFPASDPIAIDPFLASPQASVRHHFRRIQEDNFTENHQPAELGKAKR